MCLGDITYRNLQKLLVDPPKLGLCAAVHAKPQQGSGGAPEGGGGEDMTLYLGVGDGLA